MWGKLNFKIMNDLNIGVEEIKVYKCSDGTRFDDKDEAKKYFDLCEEIKKYEQKLNPRTEDCEQAKGYVQQEKDAVNEYKKNICEAAAKQIPYFAKTFIECGNGERHISHAERIISDYHIQTLNKAFSRLATISEKTFREYQQPYYANHEDEFEKQVQDWKNRKIV